MDADHTPRYGKTSEDIVGCCHQALRVVASSLILKPALGIELRSEFFGCRKVILRSIEGDGRHAVPEIHGISRMEIIGELHSLLQHVPEDGPGDLPAGQGKCAAMDCPGIRPKTASPGCPEEISGLDVDSLALSAGHKRQDKSDEPGKGKLSVSGEIFRRMPGGRVNLFGNEIKKSCKNGGKLA